MVGGDNAEADGNVTYIDASGEECSTLSDLTYKMTDQDTRKMIKLRAANEALFTGRRNAAKAAWKAILKELGLQGKVSTYQMAKKWDNLKRRYKDLKYPPVGMESVADGASSWPWFHLMNEAMEGRLASSAPLLTPVTQDDDQHPDPAPDTGPNQRGQEACDGPLGGLEREWEMVERERAALEREREMVERDRAAVERDRAAVERDRAAVQAERLWLDRERAAVERDRAMVEQERAVLGREREVLDQRALMLNSVGVNKTITILQNKI
uniref:Myb/SANT-like DNA-binding domain-containing protein n=1 Tax=Amphiprion percula TaxID=161767 RepID=A0A3P8RT16_AMPPE